jgi:hypothetical protein
MEQMFVVARTKSGFAREDSPGVSVVGAYGQEKVAHAVAMLSGAKVFPVTGDQVPPGIAKQAQELGITIPPTPGFVVTAEWRKYVFETWACVRRHNSSIPDEMLDLMKAVLLGEAPLPATQEPANVKE